MFSVDWFEMDSEFTPIQINQDHYTNDLTIFFGGNYWKHKLSMTFPAKEFKIEFYFSNDESVEFTFVGECEIDIPLFDKIAEIFDKHECIEIKTSSDPMNYAYF